MKKKSLVMMLSSLALVGTIMVGATFAYFTSFTQTASNVFTVGANLEIKLMEDVEQANATYQKFVTDNGGVILTDYLIDLSDADVTTKFVNMYPGLTLNKAPYVENISEQKCYVRAVVQGIDALDTAGFTVNGLETNGWTRVGAAEPGDILDGIYEYANVLDNAGTSADIFTSVTFDLGSAVEEAAAEAGTITVKAYAVQSTGFDSASEAFGAEATENGVASPVDGAIVK